MSCYKGATTIAERKSENFAHSFKHFECLQLHCFCFFGVASFVSKLDLDFDFGDSGFLNQINNKHLLSTSKRNTTTVTIL
jgi:hypothetical protein